MVLDKMERAGDASEMNGEKAITHDQNRLQVLIDDSDRFSLDGFQENDKKILSLLNQDSDLADNHYTFNGLARKLGMHRQSLSRSLHRLESSGLVEKRGSGYSLSKDLSSVLVKKSMVDLENLSKKLSMQSANFLQILHLYIPDEVEVCEIVKGLVGKWFGNLRWLGLAEGDGGFILQWSCSEKFQMNLKIVSRYATVESNAAGEKDRREAVVCSYRIFENIIKIFQRENHSIRQGTSSFSHYN